jgi:hypothetical protein
MDQEIWIWHELKCSTSKNSGFDMIFGATMTTESTVIGNVRQLHTVNTYQEDPTSSVGFQVCQTPNIHRLLGHFGATQCWPIPKMICHGSARARNVALNGNLVVIPNPTLEQNGTSGFCRSNVQANSCNGLTELAIWVKTQRLFNLRWPDMQQAPPPYFRGPTLLWLTVSECHKAGNSAVSHLLGSLPQSSAPPGEIGNMGTNQSKTGGTMGYYGYYRVLWFTMVYCGLLWVTLGYSGLLWVAVGYYGLLWVCLGCCRSVWGSVGYCGLLWVTMGSYGLLGVTVGYYGVLWFTY